MLTIKHRIKNVMRTSYAKYVSRRKIQNDLRIVRHQIQSSNEPIPELTAQQEQQIKAYFSQYGMEVPLQWHRLFYGKTGIHDPRFVPEPVFQSIIKPKMNDHTFAGIWSDKAYTDYLIRGVRTVRSVVRNVNGRFLNEEFSLITMNDAQKIMEQYDALVIKPSIFTDTGNGVKLLKKPFDLNKLDADYGRNYVIQIPLSQHPELARLNQSSVNTIRVNSVLFGTEAHIMSAFVKVGQAGEFADNSGHDRYFIGIRENGTFGNYAINHDLQMFEHIPSGYMFAGRAVPCYKAVCRAVERAHQCIPHFGFAFWDVCVSFDGEPTIVEVNLCYPDTTIAQVAGGPFLGKYTDDVLKYINKIR